MSFEPQNDLERSLMQAVADPAHRPQFYRDFLAADIYVIEAGAHPVHAERKTLEEGYELKIEPIVFKGKSYLPIFSSVGRIQAVIKEDAAYIGLNAREFLKMTRGADLFLNPGSDYGKEFLQDEILSLLEGSMPASRERYTVQKPTQVMIGQPAVYPTRLVEALTRLFEKNGRVRKAYLAHYLNPERGEKAHTLIALEVDGDWDQASAEAGLVASQVEVPDPPVDFLQIAGRGGIEDYFTRSVKPFYERQLASPDRPPQK